MQVLLVCELTGKFSVNLRKDALTLRNFALMDSTWKEAGLAEGPQKNFQDVAEVNVDQLNKKTRLYYIHAGLE